MHGRQPERLCCPKQRNTRQRWKVTAHSPFCRLLQSYSKVVYSRFSQKESKWGKWQHSFLKSSSTPKEITCQITVGFNQKPHQKRTLMVVLDMKSAYDLVQIPTLCRKLAETAISWGIVSWWSNYLRGKTSNWISRIRSAAFSKVGQVSNKARFRAYLNNHAEPTGKTSIVAYSHDITKMTSCAEEQLNNYLSRLAEKLVNLKMHNSKENSSATLFTTSTAECNKVSTISLSNGFLPSTKTP